MRYLAALALIVLMVFPAQAGKAKKRGITQAQYEQIKANYHRLCDDLNDPDVWLVGNISKEEMLKWCKSVAHLLYRTGELRGPVPYKSKRKVQRNRKPKKKEKKNTQKEGPAGYCSISGFC